MPGNYSKLVTVVAGQPITAGERNNEFDNVIFNMTPDGVDDASHDLVAMEATADPAGGSLATDLRGELQRLRFQIKAGFGLTNWYDNPPDISTDIADIEADIAALQATDVTHTADIDTLESDLAALQIEVDGVEADVATNTTDIAALQATDVTHTTDIDALESDVAAIVSDVSGLTSDLAALQTEVDGVEVDVANNASAITALQATDTTHTSQIAALQAHDTTLDGQITALQATDTTHTSQISALQTKDTTHDGQISALQSSDTTQNGQITTLQGTDATHTSQIAALQGTDTTHTSQISALQGSDTTQNGQITALQSGLSAIDRLRVTAQSTPGATVAVAAGVFTKSDTTATVTYAGGNSPSFAVVTANSRIDILTINDAGVLGITQGTQAASPVPPAYPADKIVLAEVTITDTVGPTIDQADIKDVRPYLNLGGAAGGSGTPIIPSGSVMVFYQASAPLGWTKLATQNDKALRVVSGSGGGSGGSQALSTTLAHSHTVNTHNHDLGSHTHSTPNHTHVLNSNAGALVASSSTHTGELSSPDSDGAAFFTSFSGASNSTFRRAFTNQTKSGGAGTAGAAVGNTGDASPGTNSQLGALAYIDVIICSKD